MEDLEDTLRDSLEVLSAVTHQEAELVLKPQKFDGRIRREIKFRETLRLGRGYHVDFQHNFKRELHRGGVDRWCQQKYKIMFDDEIIFQSSGSLSTFLNDSKINEDPRIVDRERIISLVHAIGGMNVGSYGYMDYETVTLESLRRPDGSDSFYESVYLAIMCSLKERGFKLPPILCKNRTINEAMQAGDVDKVKAMTEFELEAIRREHEQGMVRHSEIETRKITDYANRIRNKNDRTVPLIEKFPDCMVYSVPGKASSRTYNVLVIEDTGDYFLNPGGTVGKLGKKVADELATLGKYGGTNVFAAFGICTAMNICNTGQVDALVMDGGVEHITGQIFRKVFEQYSPEGVLEDFPDIEPGSQQKYWRERIFEGMRERGYNPPPSIVLPGNVMRMRVGNFVDQMLSRR
ncbi:MAG: hypothetical protein PHF67_00715 [Candidatus Nanoarchaeia archaeon]|nr:hypothetical protein [Candidatus Nanoarchaeia archaeon]